MKHESENAIKCPYCNHEFSDSWEYDEEDDQATCESCDRQFNLSVYVSTTYSTSRIDCGDLEPPEDHEYDDPIGLTYGKDTCDGYNSSNFLGKSNWEPHIAWSRGCLKCGEDDRIDAKIGVQCPWSEDKPKEGE